MRARHAPSPPPLTLRPSVPPRSAPPRPAPRSIHGNHDDPVREGTSGEVLSALDVLAMANLINYFGKSESADAVEVAPVLLAKGSTRLALYGLGSIRDDRLHRVLLAGKMTFRRPARDADAFFNLMLMRVPGGGRDGKRERARERRKPLSLSLSLSLARAPSLL